MQFYLVKSRKILSIHWHRVTPLLLFILVQRHSFKPLKREISALEHWHRVASFEKPEVWCPGCVSAENSCQKEMTENLHFLFSLKLFKKKLAFRRFYTLQHQKFNDNETSSVSARCSAHLEDTSGDY